MPYHQRNDDPLPRCILLFYLYVEKRLHTPLLGLVFLQVLIHVPFSFFSFIFQSKEYYSIIFFLKCYSSKSNSCCLCFFFACASIACRSEERRVGKEYSSQCS